MILLLKIQITATVQVRQLLLELSAIYHWQLCSPHRLVFHSVMQ